MDLPALLAELEQRHAVFRTELSQIGRALRDDEAAEGVQAVFEAFADATRFHMNREETFFFASVRALLAGDDEGHDVREQAATLEAEHVELTALARRMRDLAQPTGDIGARLIAFLDHYELHTELEDTQLFPAVMELAARAVARA